MFTKSKVSRLRVYSKYGLIFTLDSYIPKNTKLSEGHKDFLSWLYNEDGPEFIWDDIDFYKRIKRIDIEDVSITND